MGIEIAIGITALVVAGFGIWKQFYSKPVDELLHLKTQFKGTQKLSLEVQKGLEALIIKNNAWESEIFPGVKYVTYLERMKEEFEKNLSDKVYNKIESSKLSKQIIQSMIKSLEIQYSSLQQMENQIQIFTKQYN